MKQKPESMADISTYSVNLLNINIRCSFHSLPCLLGKLPRPDGNFT